jgi:hypothetical protein
MGIIIKAIQRLCSAAILGSVLAVALFAQPVRGEKLHAKNPHEVIAKYLQAFPAYVIWPTNSPATNLPPWRIAVLGNDPFDGALELAVKAKPVANREFEIIHVSSVEDLPACDVVYLATKKSEVAEKWLAEIGRRPVLTVGETADFLELGGMIQMVTVVEARSAGVRFSINLDSTKARGFSIRAAMLEKALRIVKDWKPDKS